MGSRNLEAFITIIIVSPEPSASLTSFLEHCITYTSPSCMAYCVRRRNYPSYVGALLSSITLIENSQTNTFLRFLANYFVQHTKGEWTFTEIPKYIRRMR